MAKLLLKDVLHAAVKAQKQGDLPKAERLYILILKNFPRHNDALHNLGLIKKSYGQIEESVKLFADALQEGTNTAQFWISLIYASYEAEYFEICWVKLAEFRDLNFKDRKSTELIRFFDLRIEELKKKTHIEQETQELATVTELTETGEFTDVLKYYTEVSQLRPTGAEFHLVMANYAFRVGRFETALQCVRCCLKNDFQHAESFYLAGTILMNEGEFSNASEILKHSLSLLSSNLACMNNLGICYRELGHIDLAITMHLSSLKFHPHDPKTLNNLGNCLIQQGKHFEGIEYLKKSLNFSVSLASLFNLAVAYEEIGETSLAVKNYKKIIEKDRSNTKSHRALSKYIDYNTDKSHLSDMLKLSEELKGLEHESELHFGIATAFNHQGKFFEAFKAYEKANAAKYATLDHSFEKDIKHIMKFKDAIISTAPVQPLDTRTYHKAPIFVVGMPRSGTSLVEQIISSHSEVFGAGELPYMERLIRKHLNQTLMIDDDRLNLLRNDYLMMIDELGSDTVRYVVDKTPQNFIFIDIIMHSFPEAKIIHVARDARATCWSNFTNIFASGLNYSYNLQDTVDYYNAYVDLMRYWQSIHGDRIIEVNYEKLVLDPEYHIKNLVQSVELNWESACLHPHKNHRAVATASLKQVRQKIYTGSSKAWQNYKPFIEETFNKLKVE